MADDPTPGMVSRIDQINAALRAVDENAAKRLDFLLNAGMDYTVANQIVANAMVQQQAKIMEAM